LPDVLLETPAATTAPFFIYHGFYSGPELTPSIPAAERRYFLPHATFEEQLDALAGDGFSAPSLTGFLTKPAPRSVVLTFDDGHLSNYEMTFPALLRRGFSGTFFIVAGWIGQPDRVTRGHLRELHASGMTIGSHGLTHTPLTRLGCQELMAELRNSRDILQQIVGAPVSCLAIPGGFVNTGVLDAARESGYAHVCTSVPGFARPEWLLPRFSVTAATSKAALTSLARQNRTFFLKVRAAYATRMAIKSCIGVARYEELYRILRQRPIMNK